MKRRNDARKERQTCLSSRVKYCIQNQITTPVPSEVSLGYSTQILRCLHSAIQIGEHMQVQFAV